MFHDEIRTARFRHPRVEDLGHVGVFHHGQGLTLGLEPGQHLLGVHAQLDDFQGHGAGHRLCLLGQIDDGKSAFPDLFADDVSIYPVAGAQVGD